MKPLTYSFASPISIGPTMPRILLWLMAAATVVAGLVFFPQERFRLPVIDPALIVTAALPAGLRKR